MALKRATSSKPVTPTPNATPTITVTEAQLQALIDQGVAAAMAEAEAGRVRNGYNSNVTEGVVGLTQWFKKMESVFSISNYTAASQVKFATCTLQDDALTWWNAHVKTTTPEAAHAMSWATLKKMMTDKYYPREEIDKIEKYIGGLPDMIHGSVKASKPKSMQEVIEFTTELMDEKTHAYAERQAERKRKYDDLSKNNQNQQNKRQNTGQAYTAGNSDRKSYARDLWYGALAVMVRTDTQNRWKVRRHKRQQSSSILDYRRLTVVGTFVRTVRVLCSPTVCHLPTLEGRKFEVEFAAGMLASTVFLMLSSIIVAIGARNWRLPRLDVVCREEVRSLTISLKFSKIGKYTEDISRRGDFIEVTDMGMWVSLSFPKTACSGNALRKSMRDSHKI
ncbi:putative reverse transcriptase domain-containing protein [Tanacetum coccineum]